MTWFNSLKANLGYIMVGVFSVVTFSIIMYQKQPDLYDHVLFSLEISNGVLRFGNFLYYLTVSLFTFFSSNLNALKVSAISLLTASVILKYHISLKYLIENTSNKSIYFLKYCIPINILAFCLVFIFSLPTTFSATWYLGQFPPNIWHNSTTIFVMPFVLLLFIDFTNYLKQPKLVTLIRLIFWIIINALIKPSFLFCFLPVGFLYQLFIFGFRRQFYISLILTFFTALGISWVGLFNFYFKQYITGAGIEVNLFYVWSLWSNNILLSIFASIPFPLLIIFKSLKLKKVPLELSLAWVLLVVGIIIYSLFSETGDGWIIAASNFSWQLIMVNFILYLVSLKVFLTMVSNSAKLKGFNLIVLFVFFMQTIIGLFYLLKIPFFGYR